MRIKRALHSLGKALALLIFMMAAFALMIAFEPRILLNETTLKLGTRYINSAMKPDSEIRYAAADVSSEYVTILKKKIALRFKDFCWVSRAQGEVCLGLLELGAEVDLSGFAPVLDRVGPVRILGGRAVIASASGKSAKRKSDTVFSLKELEKWLGRFRGTGIGEVELDFPEVRLNAMHASLFMKGDGKKDQPFTAQGRLDFQTSQGGRFKTDFRLASESGELQGPWTWRTKGAAKLKTKTFQTKADVSTHGRLQADQISGSLEVGAGALPFFDRIGVGPCNFSFRRKNDSDGSLESECDFVAEVARLGKRNRLPRKAVLHAHSRAQLPFLPDPDARIEAEIVFTPGPVFAPLIEAKGGGKATFAGIPARFPESWTATLQLDSAVSIPDFQRVARGMRHTRWPVPAPLDVLEGQTSLQAKGTVDLIRGGAIQIPIATRLQSAHQRLNLDVATRLELLSWKAKERVRIDSDVLFSDVRLSLPRMGLDAPFRFIPDPRIGAAAKFIQLVKPNPWLSYSVHVRTARNRPLQLSSNLLTAPIPMQVDVNLRNQRPITGSLWIDDVPVPVVGHASGFDRIRTDFQAPPQELNRTEARVTIEERGNPITLLLPGRLGMPQNTPMGDPMPAAIQLMISVVLGLSPELLAGNTELNRIPGLPEGERIPTIIALRRRY